MRWGRSPRRQDSAALKAARIAHTGEASPLAKLNAGMRDVPADQKAAAGKLIGEARAQVRRGARAGRSGHPRRRGDRSVRGRSRRRDRRAVAPPSRRPASTLSAHGADGRHLRRDGVGGRGGARARARLVQLRRPQHRPRPPGPRRAGHVLRRAGRPQPRAAQPDAATCRSGRCSTGRCRSTSSRRARCSAKTNWMPPTPRSSTRSRASRSTRV